MASSFENVTKRLDTSATSRYDLSKKLSRVPQVLPNATSEYEYFASQVLYITSNFEHISAILSTLQPSNDKTALLKDLDSLINFADELQAVVQEAFPQRPFDGAEVDLLLPPDVYALSDQLDALQVGTSMVMAVLQPLARGKLRLGSCLRMGGSRRLL